VRAFNPWNHGRFLTRGVLAMKATDFEYRHETLVHQFIVAAAFLMYFVEGRTSYGDSSKTARHREGLSASFLLSRQYSLLLGPQSVHGGAFIVGQRERLARNRIVISIDHSTSETFSMQSA
jgi:hypothetical protein